MTLEQQILALLAEAEPLRCLPDEEAEARGLPQLVERINLLRGMQMTQAADSWREAQLAEIGAQLKAGTDAALAEALFAQAPKRRGRPPKAKVEGSDA